MIFSINSQGKWRQIFRKFGNVRVLFGGNGRANWEKAASRQHGNEVKWNKVREWQTICWYSFSSISSGRRLSRKTRSCLKCLRVLVRVSFWLQEFSVYWIGQQNMIGVCSGVVPGQIPFKSSSLQSNVKFAYEIVWLGRAGGGAGGLVAVPFIPNDNRPG